MALVAQESVYVTVALVCHASRLLLSFELCHTVHLFNTQSPVNNQVGLLPEQLPV